jgi:hypothetical protein
MMEHISARTQLSIMGYVFVLLILLFLILHFTGNFMLALVIVGILSFVGIGTIFGYLAFIAWQRRAVEHRARIREIERADEMHETEKWRIEQALLHSQEIEKERIRLEQMKAANEHTRMMLDMQWQQQHIVAQPGHTLFVQSEDGYVPMTAPQITPRSSSAKQGTEEIGEVEIPKAPKFPEMSHLLTSERMVLCYTDKGPAYGTVDDLLSMAVTGKPGRGKTTALMYYVTMLLQAGAEVFVWDPHGAMSDLSVLNGRHLPNLPVTAKVTYLDRKDDIVGSIPALLKELEVRDNLYRDGHQTKHPLLILADELPVLADYDDEIALEYKAINKQHVKANEEEEIVPSLITVIRKFVLEARKWRCFFIGSGQSFDAEILPTRVTENFNSRIVFFSSDRRARMSGLENDAIKTLLPIIRNAANGTMVFDCSRWDGPIIGAIPYIEVKDMMTYLGVSSGTHREGSGNVQFERNSMPDIPMKNHSLYGSTMTVEAPEFAVSNRDTGKLEKAVNPLLDDAGSTPDELPAFGNDDLLMNDLQVKQFMVLYPAIGNIVKCLERIDNGKGQGLGKRYFKHASRIVKQHGLRKESK